MTARLDAIAAIMTPEDVALVHAGLRTLAANSENGNGPGFREKDANIGQQLAERDHLTTEQAAVAVVVCRRYPTQLGETRERAAAIVRSIRTPTLGQLKWGNWPRPPTQRRTALLRSQPT